MEGTAFGARVTRLTPKFLRPKSSPRTRLDLPFISAANFAGYTDGFVQTGTSVTLTATDALPLVTILLRLINLSANAPMSGAESAQRGGGHSIGWLGVAFYSAAMNSSAETSACLSSPDNVPILISECSGITQPRLPSFTTTWLPRCRTFSNPNRWNARSAPVPRCPRRAEA